MDISFTDIAFENKFSSNLIDAIYAYLDILNNGERKMSINLLKKNIHNLPLDFGRKLMLCNETDEITFEARSTIDRSPANDWDLLVYD